MTVTWGNRAESHDTLPGALNHSEEWGQFQLPAIRAPGAYWGRRPWGRGFAVLQCVCVGGDAHPCRACGVSPLVGPPRVTWRCLTDCGVAVAIVNGESPSSLISSEEEAPPPLFHRIAGASAFCALRVNGLISQSALPVCGAGSRGDLHRPHACAQGQGAGPRPVVCLANFVIAFGNYAFLFISLVKEIN